MSRFIGIHEHALSDELCAACIARFDASPHASPGRTGHGVDEAKKRSLDITLDDYPDQWRSELLAVRKAVLGGLRHYLRSHPFLLAGALSLSLRTPDGAAQEITAEAVRNLPDAELDQLIMTVYRLGTVNLQKYDQGRGGYFHWHSEHYPHPSDPSGDALHRVLLWMFYLNDVADGGATEFYYQDVKIPPRRGTLVIAPAGFTHTHRGAIPVSDDKYILTSWVLYRTAAELYGRPPQR